MGNPAVLPFHLSPIRHEPRLWSLFWNMRFRLFIYVLLPIGAVSHISSSTFLFLGTESKREMGTSVLGTQKDQSVKNVIS